MRHLRTEYMHNAYRAGPSRAILRGDNLSRMSILTRGAFRFARMSGATAVGRTLRPGAVVLCYHNVVAGPVPATSIPDQEREHPIQTLHASGTHLLPQVDDDLAVRVRAERVPPLAQLLGQLHEVDDTVRADARAVGYRFLLEVGGVNPARGIDPSRIARVPVDDFDEAALFAELEVVEPLVSAVKRVFSSGSTG